MESGWLVEYVDGTSYIMTERAFAEHEEKIEKESVALETHYFDIQAAIKKHPMLEVRY